MGFLGGSEGKRFAHNVGNWGLILGLGRRREKGMATPVLLPGNSMDRGVWQATVHRNAKSQTRTEQTNTFSCGES